MPYDVFISHSKQDKAVAEALCAMLEAEKIRCWIAPRDINPGDDWAGAIMGALESCRVMILVFSSSSNTSPQVKREVEQAFNNGLTVVPFRIEDVQPNPSLKYYIGSVHWLDALTEPLERHIAKLVPRVKAIVEISDATAPSPPDTKPLPASVIHSKGEAEEELWPRTTTAEKKRLEEVQEIVLPGSVKLKLRRCPAGTFMMGSPASEAGRDKDETQHQVTISKPFWMGMTQVTQAQWQALMGNNPSFSQGADLPVETVSWDDAVAFCRKLTEQERQAGRLAEYEFRLPTEAEWEYACRTGSTGSYAGSGRLDDMGWYYENAGDKRLMDKDWDFDDFDVLIANTNVITHFFDELNANNNRTHAVGLKSPNAWGLYDMHGNVWEWCQDWYGNYPTGAVIDPIGPVAGDGRAFRGGSWYDPSRLCRSANRDKRVPDRRDEDLGFRVALVAVRP